MVLVSEIQDVVIIGYSGHAFVIVDAILACGGTLKGYCDEKVKELNPYELNFLGKESLSILSASNWIVGIGDNQLRKSIQSQYVNHKTPATVIHPGAIISSKIKIGDGVFVAANATINPLSAIGDGVIINTGAIIEHECTIGHFSHIAPGAVLAGNVTIGEGTFVGANSVIKQGVKIGNNVTIGAGTVILKNVPDNVTIVGNPGKIIKHNI